MVDSSLTDEMILMLDLPAKPNVRQALQGLLRLLNLNALLPSLEVRGSGPCRHASINYLSSLKSHGMVALE